MAASVAMNLGLIGNLHGSNRNLYDINNMEEFNTIELRINDWRERGIESLKKLAESNGCDIDDVPWPETHYDFVNKFLSRQLDFLRKVNCDFDMLKLPETLDNMSEAQQLKYIIIQELKDMKINEELKFQLINDINECSELTFSSQKDKNMELQKYDQSLNVVKNKLKNNIKQLDLFFKDFELLGDDIKKGPSGNMVCFFDIVDYVNSSKIKQSTTTLDNTSSSLFFNFNSYDDFNLKFIEFQDEFFRGFGVRSETKCPEVLESISRIRQLRFLIYNELGEMKKSDIDKFDQAGHFEMNLKEDDILHEKYKRLVYFYEDFHLFLVNWNKFVLNVYSYRKK